jgi:hypothetical protein
VARPAAATSRCTTRRGAVAPRRMFAACSVVVCLRRCCRRRHDARPFTRFLSRWCSFRLSVINWWHVFTGAYAPWVLWAVLAATVAQLVPLFRSMDTTAFASALSVSTGHVQQLWPLYITLFVLLVLILNHRSNPVFLLDFACAQPPESWKTTHQGGCRRVPWCRRGAIRRPLRACDILRTDCSGGGCGCCVGSRGALGVTAGWQLPAGLLLLFFGRHLLRLRAS